MQIAPVVFCSLGISLLGLACSPKAPEPEARERLAQVLRDSLGTTTNPNVAFIIDGIRRDSHLYVMFDTTAVGNVSDSGFEHRARDLARFAVRHYDKADKLDSVTVATREGVKPGVWRVHHSQTFAITGLNTP